MSTTQSRPSSTADAARAHEPTRPDGGRRVRGRSGRRLLVLVVALAVVTGVVMVAWWQLGRAPERTAPAAGSTGGWVVGSLYDQQVPDYADWAIGYGPGSMLYREQVPFYIDWSAGYGPGSSLYRSQVPRGR